MDVEQEITSAELAKVIGVSARRVQQLAKDGTLSPVSLKPTKFKLNEAVADYIKFLNSTLGDAQLTKKAKNAKNEKMIYEAGIKKSQEEIEKLKLGELKGHLHRSEDVRMAFDDLVMSFRASVLAMPGRLSMDVSKETSPAICSTIISKECNRVLEELSHHEYDPNEYIKKAEAREREEAKKDK